MLNNCVPLVCDCCSVQHRAPRYQPSLGRLARSGMIGAAWHCLLEIFDFDIHVGADFEFDIYSGFDVAFEL